MRPSHDMNRHIEPLVRLGDGQRDDFHEARISFYPFLFAQICKNMDAAGGHGKVAG